MAHHHLRHDQLPLHDRYDHTLAPVLAIESGDTVSFTTLDVAWGAALPEDRYSAIPSHSRPMTADHGGPPLVGPIYISAAMPGDLLSIQIEALRPVDWGWTRAGGREVDLDRALGVSHETRQLLKWSIDAGSGFATTQFGQRVKLPPFMGMMGVCPPPEGDHDAWTPRIYGGNLDCRELGEGATLYLPVAVEGALFSTGDGHAAQGDGEVCGMALECGMEEVRLRFEIERAPLLATIHAKTREGFITFGFARDLKDAACHAMNHMLDLMMKLYGLKERSDALALASVVVDLRVTQLANPLSGIHAVLRRDAISL